MKLPFIQWGKTSEGAWTLFRLCTALTMIGLAIWTERTYTISLYLSIPIIIFGLGIMLDSAFLFLTRPEFKIMLDGKPTDSFYQEGLYKHVRHPFYSGFWLVMLGVLFSHFNWYFMLLFIVYTILTSKAAREEEKRLIDRFNGGYYLYTKRVPRFAPHHIFRFIKTLFHF